MAADVSAFLSDQERAELEAIERRLLELVRRAIRKNGLDPATPRRGRGANAAEPRRAAP
jgi:hypothetical protein